MTLVNGKKTAAPRDTAPLRRLDEGASAPLYEVVKRQMSEAILLGEWPSGTVLPSEVSLARTFGVAVGTVRRALVDLAAEGLLARRRKTGTIVTGRTPHHTLRFFFHYFRLHGLDGSLQRSHAKLRSLTTGPATQIERDRLQLEDGAEVLRLHRTRHVDGHPVMLDEFTLALERVPDFPLDEKRVPELLYLHLLEQYGIRISAVREQLSADLATAEDLALLNLTAPAAVLTIEDVAYDQSGTPTIFSIHKATTATHRYVNEIR